MKIINFLFTFLIIFSLSAFSQTKVKIDFKTQKYIGDVSLLDRTKYFEIHDGRTDIDALNQFRTDYNVVTGGRMFWGPDMWAHAPCCGKAELPNFPSYTPGTTNKTVREVDNIVATQHPSKSISWSTNVEEAAAWTVEYFLDIGTPPKFYEPMNEPFVHADDADFSGDQPDANLMSIHMASFFGAVGKAIDEEPLLANVNVIGYSSAWPSIEKWDFGHWESRQKMFMDTAGQYMDAFAVHLYDGINVTGNHTLRSGSNSEAILDLIETYSNFKWDITKPHAITEYGGIINKAYDTRYPGYHDIKSVQSVKSNNQILFNLLNREDRLLISIPFITGGHTTSYLERNNYIPYGADLFVPTTPGVPPPEDGYTWKYTPKVYFYKLWQNVQGERVLISSDNPDIQTQAFASGNMLYLAFNNLDDYTQIVHLDFLTDLEEFSSLTKRALKIWDNKQPIYSENIANEVPDSLEMIAGETIILELEFNSDLTFGNIIRSARYYSKNHLVPIKANVVNTFNFNAIDAGVGYATLKMGLGRALNLSKQPELYVNGNLVKVPNNWAGYDQLNRGDDGFFGTIDIPIPMDYLKTDNEVTLKFNQNGGRISHLILEVMKYDNPPINTNSDDNIETKSSISVFPNPTSGNFSITVPENNMENTIVIYDIVGKLEYCNLFDGKSLKLSSNELSLSKGMYFVVVSNARNKYTQTLIIR